MKLWIINIGLTIFLVLSFISFTLGLIHHDFILLGVGLLFTASSTLLNLERKQHIKDPFHR